MAAPIHAKPRDAAQYERTFLHVIGGENGVRLAFVRDAVTSPEIVAEGLSMAQAITVRDHSRAIGRRFAA